MAHEFSTSVLKDSIALFHYYKSLGERAMAQVTDAQLFEQLDPESNSIAIVVKHMAGNMRSRWTDFLTTDGEKPDRHRDQEFEFPQAASCEDLLKMWAAGWDITFSALAPLSDADLERKVFIRSEPHSVMQAIHRQLAHYAYHVGQIVYLAKHFQSNDWQSLTIPRKRP